MTDSSVRDSDSEKQDLIFVQGDTLHKGGGITLEQNGRFVQICMGEDKRHQCSFSPKNALKLAARLQILACEMKDKAERQALQNGGRNA